MRLTKQTIGNWRTRFLAKRPDGLLDEPRPGAPRTVTDAEVEVELTRTLRTKPASATQSSTRSMAHASGLSRSRVNRIWPAFALQPHRSETFKLSQDPLFIETVRDTVGLDLHPPDRALVLCVDKRSQIQILDRTEPLLPMRPGQVERRTHDYVQHGTTSQFAALDAKSGKVIGQLHRRYRAIEFRTFLDTIDAEAPADFDAHLMFDNYGTQKTPPIHSWLARHRRFHFHFTPTSSSWLNLVERWFALLTDKQIKRGAHRSTQALEVAITTRLVLSNTAPKPFVWNKSADGILASVARFCHRISGTRH